MISESLYLHNNFPFIRQFKAYFTASLNLKERHFFTNSFSLKLIHIISSLTPDSHIASETVYSAKDRFRDYLQLSKLRLTSLVILTAVLGYILAVVKTQGEGFSLFSLIGLILGGLGVVASSNAINQILEKDYDKLMSRTEERPLATGRMKMIDAMVFSFITGVGGIFILGLTLNATCAFLGFASLIVYAFLYTPVKRISPLAVMVGAFPGAVPPLLGWVGYTGEFGFDAMLIYGIQFFWQFPHFWSLAWVLHEDYQKAGYFLLPSRQGKGKKSAFQILWYSFVLFLVSILPWYFERAGNIYLIIATILGSIMIYLSYRLYVSLSDRDAKKLMFSSFIFIPIILIALLF
jgi:protoheme IX farnesyltransferase